MKTLLAVSGGIVVGLVAGILTAPKSGKETRKNIKDGLDKMKNKADEIAQKGKEQIKDAVDEVKHAANSSSKNAENIKQKTA